MTHDFADFAIDCFATPSEYACENHFTSYRRVKAAYETWCEENGEVPLPGFERWLSESYLLESSSTVVTANGSTELVYPIDLSVKGERLAGLPGDDF